MVSIIEVVNAKNLIEFIDNLKFTLDVFRNNEKILNDILIENLNIKTSDFNSYLLFFDESTLEPINRINKYIEENFDEKLNYLLINFNDVRKSELTELNNYSVLKCTESLNESEILFEIDPFVVVNSFPQYLSNLKSELNKIVSTT